MYLRSSYLELIETDHVLENFDLFLNHALDRRHAWFSGWALGMGMDEAIIMADDRGYNLWAPEVTANGQTQRTNTFVGVRKDLYSGDLEKYFELLRLGRMGNTPDTPAEDLGYGEIQGFVGVSFQPDVKGLGKLHVAVCPMMDDRMLEIVTEWYDKSALDLDTGFFTSLNHNLPLSRSSVGRVTKAMNTSATLNFAGHNVYQETTFVLRAI